MTELGQKRGDERGEQTGTTGRVKAERECPYLLINRPFRKGKTPKIPRGRKERGGLGGLVMMVGRRAERGRVPLTLSANPSASPAGGSWGSRDSLELRRKKTGIMSGS